jgi:hypothetical protein
LCNANDFSLPARNKISIKPTRRAPPLQYSGTRIATSEVTVFQGKSSARLLNSNIIDCTCLLMLSVHDQYYPIPRPTFSLFRARMARHPYAPGQEGQAFEKAMSEKTGKKPVFGEQSGLFKRRYRLLKLKPRTCQKRQISELLTLLT